MQTLELLAPAKNLECGKAAIEHGADAVYIGASKFGARASAGNSISDVSELCKYAHQFGAKVYVTVNTIIYENEIEDTRALLRQLCKIKVDALLVQDMAVLQLLPTDIKPLPALHASTQTDNRSAEKVDWLQTLGFKRAVLARELSLKEINTIHKMVPHMELEAFVHGALCVSYSGVCYASQHCFGRSANRGACAQFCRLKFDLIDANGKEIRHQQHLLSLKDLSQIEYLEEMADAGVSSFKIEGRLKDIDYVKNVVSAYSQKLNAVISHRKNDYQRTSLGQVTYMFTPDLKKTFNRGYTNYFLYDRQPDIYSPLTPKALGEYVGKVKEITHNSFSVAGTACFANGDGLCFINDEGELEGFRINRVEGNRLYPLHLPQKLHRGMALYRNNDEAFSKILSGKTAMRKIPIHLSLSATQQGFMLKASGKGLQTAEIQFIANKQVAQNPQRNNILRQLGKLGGTPYVAKSIDIAQDTDNYFIPSSMLADWRRQVIDKLQIALPQQISVQMDARRNDKCNKKNIKKLTWQPEYKKFPYIYNIANSVAQSFYQQQGLKNTHSAYEVISSKKANQYANQSVLLMSCRHCLRYSLGYCIRRGGKKPTWKEPLILRLGDGRTFRLEFKCDECQMNIYTNE